MLAFTLVVDDVVIASFTTGPGSATLPIRIYSEVRLGVKPEIKCDLHLVIADRVVIVVASLVSSSPTHAARARRRCSPISVILSSEPSRRASKDETRPCPSFEARKRAPPAMSAIALTQG